MKLFIYLSALWAVYTMVWLSMDLILPSSMAFTVHMSVGVAVGMLVAALLATRHNRIWRGILTDRAEKLQAFKDYVHARLDKAGVPVDPNPASTRETGCRIGSRLNWALSPSVALTVSEEGLALLASAWQVAARRGDRTDWEALQSSLEDVLACHGRSGHTARTYRVASFEQPVDAHDVACGLEQKISFQPPEMTVQQVIDVAKEISEKAKDRP